jgi:hypothetical protein
MIERQELPELLNSPFCGWVAVTLVCRILPDPASIATKTYRIRNEAVTEIKKSQATTERA